MIRLLNDLDIPHKKAAGQSIIDCPECGKESHCHVAPDTGLWHCKVCSASGNPYQLIGIYRPASTPRERMELLERLGLNGSKGIRKESPKQKSFNPDTLGLREITVEDRAEDFCETIGISPGALPFFDPQIKDGGLNGRVIYLPAVPGDGKICGYLRVRFDGKPYILQSGKTEKYPVIGKHGLLCVPWLQETKPETILFCEGWRDCAAAMEAGYDSTASTGGASTWRDDWLCLFRNRNVIIIMDCDTAGQKAAQRAADALYGKAQSVKIVRLPYEVKAKSGEDLDDFLNRDKHTKDDLQKLIDSAAVYRKESSGSEDKLPQPAAPFPVDCIPEPGRTLIQDIAESVNVDASFPATAYLAVCAGLIGASRKVQVKRGWYEPAILWAAIIGRPSSGKTPAVDAVMAPLKPIEKGKIELFDSELKTYQAEKESCKKGDPQPEKPVCERTVIGDTTTEALCLRLKENPQGLLLYRDELSGWIGSFNQYKKGGSDEAHFLSIWSGKAVRVDRKTDEQFLYIEKPNLSIVGGIQPGTLIRKLRGEHLDNGLAQRFLYAFPDDRVRGWTDATIEDRIIQDVQIVYATLLSLMSDDNSECQLVKLNADAQEIIRNYCNTLAVEIDVARDITAEALGKLPGYLARIALVLHELKNSETLLCYCENNYCITSETMSEAVRIANWFKNEAIRVFDFFGDDGESGGLQSPKHKQIEMWLKNRITDSPVLAETLQTEASEQDFSWVYVQKVAKSIGIEKFKSDAHGGKYVWAA